MDARKELDDLPYEDLIARLASLAESSAPTSLDDLCRFLIERDRNTFTKFDTPRVVCLALLQKGKDGVARMIAALPEMRGVFYSQCVIEALWYAAEGQIIPESVMYSARLVPPLNAPLDAETVVAAASALNALVSESLQNEDTFERVVGFLFAEKFTSVLKTEDERCKFRTRVFDAFTRGRIKVTDALLCDFRQLIAREAREEEYQRFLETNPAFLDPLANTVISKHRLGAEFVTDFVIRRLDNKYLVVEIEKPSDQIFTSNNDFSAKFSHAFGQVLDFQQWIDNHPEYARTQLPALSSPRGLLIIGMASSLTSSQRQKLHRFNSNSNFVQVKCFDEVAQEAETLYRNIIHW